MRLFRSIFRGAFVGALLGYAFGFGWEFFAIGIPWLFLINYSDYEVEKQIASSSKASTS